MTQMPPKGENQGDWQVEIGQGEAEGNDGPNDDTYVIRGNENRVLDASQLNPHDGEQVGGDQEGLAEYHRGIREAEEGVEDGGDHGGLAEGDQDAQGQVATGLGSTLSPGNSPPPRGSPALTGPQAIQWKLKQKLDAAAKRQVLQDQMAQVDRDARTQADREREEAHQESQKLEAQRERTRQKAESKRVKTREAAEMKKKGG
jgi:hypothetical protein